MAQPPSAVAPAKPCSARVSGPHSLQELAQSIFIDYWDFEFLRLVKLGSGIASCKHVIRLLAHRSSDLPPSVFDHLLGLVSTEVRQGAGENKGLPS